MVINNDWHNFIDYVNAGGEYDKYPGYEKLYEMTTIQDIELI